MRLVQGFSHDTTQILIILKNLNKIFVALKNLSKISKNFRHLCQTISLFINSYMSSISLFSAVHEKIFVVFMVSSLCFMLLNTIIFKWTRAEQMTETVSLLVMLQANSFYLYKHFHWCHTHVMRKY